MSAGRNALLAKVHLAKKQMGLDDATYRAVMQRVTGQDSAAKCPDAKLVALIEEFKRQGFAPAPAGKKPQGKAWVRKVYAIWNDLSEHLEDPTQAALNGFVARQTKSRRNPAGISAPEFLTAEEATKVIQGLEGWLARERAKKDAA